MKYLIITDKGDYLPIALKLKREGHEVFFYVKDPHKRNIGLNLVNTVNSFTALKPDITLIDLPLSHQVSRKVGGKCFGVSEFMDFFCHNKQYFEDICRLADLSYNTQLSSDNSIEAWFNGERFVLPVFHHTYTKKLLAGDTGDTVQDGYMSVTSQAVAKFCKKYENTLGKLSDTLKNVQYSGLVRLELCGDTLCYVTTKLNIPTFLELLDVPLGKIIEQSVGGKLQYIPTHREKAVAIRISVPPFPYCPKFFWGFKLYHMNGMKLYDHNDKQMKHLWCLNVYRGDNGTMLSSGHSGDLGYVTALAGMFMSKEGGRRIKRTISNLGINNLQYRVDRC